MGVSKRRKRSYRGERQKTLQDVRKLVIGSFILIVLLVIFTGFALLNSVNAKIPDCSSAAPASPEIP